jgi:hypothetical protein
MKRYLCLIGLAITLALCVLPATASAESEQYRFQDKIAYASFQRTEGCISTTAEVFLYEFRSQAPPGPPDVTGPAMEVYVSRFDNCQFVSLSEIGKFVELTPESFTFSHGLQSARLNTTIDAYDWSTGSTVPLSIDVAWEGVGERRRDSLNGMYSSPNLRVIWRMKGTFREATATGTVLMGTMNVSPDPSTFASLGVAHTGDVYIYRP